MSEKQAKNSRILYVYQQLREGKVVRKSEAAQRFHVDERSIQRDIDDIRAFFSELAASSGDSFEVVYDRQQKGFLLSGCGSPLMTNSEILAVSKILLSSRAFTKAEMSRILDKLISGCVPARNMKLVSDLLSNEKFHYVELTNPAGIQEKLWDMGADIQQHQLMEIAYRRQGEAEAATKRIIEPVSILFSEYYFYLNAYIVEQVGGSYQHKYDYPAIFRVDRIASYRLLDEKFTLPYASRFQEGEFRKRIQFMYPGRLIKLRFRYTGTSVEAMLDRLPTAKILEESDQGYLLEAEVYGNGVAMWLLSQGDRVEVLAPQSLRQAMREILTKTLALYED